MKKKMNISTKIVWCILLMVGSLSPSFAQQITFVKIKGVVRNLSGDAVPLVDVKVKGMHLEKQFTDSLGNFVIEVPSKNATLIFDYPDYKSKEVFLDGKETLEVVLIDNDVKSSNDVLSLPYQKVQKRDLTGAGTDIDNAYFNEQSAVNVENALQGRVSGVRVVSSNGAPGAGASVQIRGINSLYCGNQPLYVIDGLPVPSKPSVLPLAVGADNSFMTDLNPKDIESITVLKDASATALYGSRGSNGVILITTHRGTEKGTTLDFNAQTGVQSMPADIPVLNADEYRNYLTSLLYKSGMTADELAKKYGNYLLSDTKYFDAQRYNNSTDWDKKITRTALMQDYHLKLKVGDGISKYAIMAGYTGYDGVVTNSDMKRITARFNMDYKFSDKLKISNQIAFTRVQLEQQAQSNSVYNPLLIAKTKSPFMAVYAQETDGSDKKFYDTEDFNNKTNPVALVNEGINENIRTRVLAMANVEYKIDDNLTANFGLNLDFNSQRENLFIPAYAVAKQGYTERTSSQQLDKEFTYLGEATLNYNKLFNDLHNITAVAGVSYQFNQSKIFLGRTLNALNDQYTTLGLGKDIDSVGSTETKALLMSYFGNVNYAYKDRYLASVSLRADGSSRFGSNNVFGYFPAIGAAWRVSSEPFFNVNFVDEVKLKTSYGLTGNNNIGDSYTKTTLIASNYQQIGGVRPYMLANPDIKWETTAQFNIGADASLLKNRLMINLDYYQKTTTDVLMPNQVSSTSGYSYFWKNSGTVENKGLEFSIFARVLTGEFKWDIDFSISKNKNTVKKLANEGEDLVFTYAGVQTIEREGQAFGSFYGFKTNGLYQTDAEVKIKNGDGYTYRQFKAGDVKFVDVNNDGVLDDKDKVVIGNPNPDYYGGFNNLFSFKGFELGIFLEFQQGNDIYNAMRKTLESGSTLDNQSTAVKQQWVKEGDNGLPALELYDYAGNSRMSDRWVEDGSYIRLKKISIGYNVPKKYLTIGAASIQYLKIFASAENVFTRTKYLGYDPDVNNSGFDLMPGVDFGSIPQLKSVLVGVKIGF